ncbi:hypothetical protein MXD63_19120 [Frankia sp. Cpl3]|nr:hypothetical protein [Frankia sp. Cpl3]
MIIPIGRRRSSPGVGSAAVDVGVVGVEVGPPLGVGCGPPSVGVTVTDGVVGLGAAGVVAAGGALVGAEPPPGPPDTG